MSGRRSRGPVLLHLAFVLLVSACGSDRGGPPQLGDTAPDFEAPTLDGEVLDLAALRGSPVLLNLWATWCVPCRTETPFLQSIHETYGPEGLRVVGVTVDGRGSLRQIHSFLDEFGVTYDILHDAQMTSMDIFSAWGLPATYLMDRDGRLRFIRMGPVDEEDQEFHAALEAVL